MSARISFKLELKRNEKEKKEKRKWGMGAFKSYLDKMRYVDR